eukprot:1034623-Prymnesium_polylepis.1
MVKTLPGQRFDQPDPPNPQNLQKERERQPELRAEGASWLPTAAARSHMDADFSDVPGRFKENVHKHGGWRVPMLTVRASPVAGKGVFLDAAVPNGSLLW